MNEQKVQTKFKIFSNLNNLNVITNYEVKDFFILKKQEQGLKHVFPQLDVAINFYNRGPLNILMKSKTFLAYMNTQSLIENKSNIQNDYFENFLIDDLREKINSLENNILPYYDSFISNLNSLSYIKAESPSILIYDLEVIKEFHKNFSSPDELCDIFNKFWDVYEFSLKYIPESKLLFEKIILITDLIDDFKHGKKLIIKNRLFFNENDIYHDEAISLFKEMYHDALLEYKIKTYF